MRVESSYPTPIFGVSTLAPRNRHPGQASAQENFRSDPVSKLTKRPSLQWDARLHDTGGTVQKHHEYVRNGNVYTYLVGEDGVVRGYVNGQDKIVTGDIASYVGTLPRLELSTIDHVTYVLNKDKITQIGSTTDTDLDAYRKVSHVNITAALNYSETITLVVLYNNGASSLTVSHSVPALGVTDPDYDAADLQRATARVALGLASEIVALQGNVTATNKGSSLGIYNAVTDEWVQVEITVEGQGSTSARVVNETIDTLEGLPLYAIPNTRVTMRPDPTRTEGTYYLESQRISTQPAPANPYTMEEVVWVEARAHDEPYSLLEDTMPHIAEYLPATDEFVVGVAGTGTTKPWAEREAGDNESCRVPGFIGNTITTLGYFQKRLVAVSNNTVHMTRTEDVENWWKDSALSLLITDPIEITSSAVGIDALSSIVTHNRDLLIIASNGQFKLDGTIAITPQTVSMPLTTSYDITTDVQPISLGNAVYYSTSYGQSTGIQEYTSKRNTTQDQAINITDHVIGYMPGKCRLLAGSANLGMIVVATEDSPPNELFVYEHFIEDKTTHRTWSKWTFPEADSIINVTFRDDRLTIISLDNGNIIEKHISMYSRIAVGENNVYLDNEVELGSQFGSYVTTPTGYTITENTIVIGGANAPYPLDIIPYTVSGSDLVFDTPLPEETDVIVGEIFRCTYRPTRPFIFDKNGQPVTTNRVRIGKYILHVANTDTVGMKIISAYNDIPDQEFSGRNVNSINNIVGELSLTTGDVKFSYSQDARLAEAEFFAESHLGLTITGISWEGQYHQAAKRL